VNMLRVPDALRSDVNVLGSIRFISEGFFLKGEQFEVTTHVRTGLLTPSF